MDNAPALEDLAPDPELNIEELADNAVTEWRSKSIHPGDDVIDQMRSCENEVAELVYELGGSSTGVGRRASEIEGVLNDCKRQAVGALEEAEDVETKIKEISGIANISEIAENVDLEAVRSQAQEFPVAIERPMNSAADAGDMLRRVVDDLYDKGLDNLAEMADSTRRKVMNLADEMTVWQQGAASAEHELGTELIDPLKEQIDLMSAQEPQLAPVSAADNELPDAAQPTVQSLNESEPVVERTEPQPSKGWNTEFGL